MWTTVLVITLYSSVWCIHGHIQWFMPHNSLFPKVASPSQCASLWRDVRHARVRWLCWQIFRTFQTCNRLWREAERVAKFIQNVTNIFIFHLTQSFRCAMSSGHLQSDEIPDGKITHRYTAANQVRARDTALQSVVEDMKTILYWWEMPTRWHMMSEKQLSILIQGRNYARGNRQIIRIPRAFACISAGAPWLWRSVMQIDKVSQEPARLRMLTAPFHGTFFSIGSS